tara:strand:+ start:404 stop:1195 length:792 start_codon:yes stop_codon:yes gene_type:complete
MKKILVLGSNNMAGHLIYNFLKEKNEFSLFGIKEEKFEVYSYSFSSKINRFNPDIIINALRITVEKSEEDPKRALFINSIIPKWLEKKFFKTKVKIIHLSTDCVFSGLIGNYVEDDLPDGKNVYSASKFLGEIINNKDLTIRTSYVGPNLKNKNEELFDWFLFLNQSKKVKGYKYALWNGITTLELAKDIYLAIQLNISGLYHLVSDKKISKFELLSLINSIFKCDILIEESKDEKLDRSLSDSRKIMPTKKHDIMFKELYEY